mmetsp:Transcript_15299/g.57851  ORF Transcript_15299/g.57851 Transcript_15299/m.57851 type:complete len:225 (+) Transcript_15299:211-885(+)
MAAGQLRQTARPSAPAGPLPHSCPASHRAAQARAPCGPTPSRPRRSAGKARPRCWGSRGSAFPRRHRRRSRRRARHRLNQRARRPEPRAGTQPLPRGRPWSWQRPPAARGAVWRWIQSRLSTQRPSGGSRPRRPCPRDRSRTAPARRQRRLRGRAHCEPRQRLLVRRRTRPATRAAKAPRRALLVPLRHGAAPPRAPCPPVPFATCHGTCRAAEWWQTRARQGW